jgi:hypothetical protein
MQENQMSHEDSLAGHALSSRKPKAQKKDSKKEVHKMHITKAHGGYHIVHEHTDPAAHPQEEHVAPDMASLQEHVGEHMGEPEAGAEPGAQAAAQPEAE